MTKQGKVFALFVMSEQVSLIGTWWALVDSTVRLLGFEYDTSQ